jgi:hypothetical protein
MKTAHHTPTASGPFNLPSMACRTQTAARCHSVPLMPSVLSLTSIREIPLPLHDTIPGPPSTAVGPALLILSITQDTPALLAPVRDTPDNTSQKGFMFAMTTQGNTPLRCLRLLFSFSKLLLLYLKSFQVFVIESCSFILYGHLNFHWRNEKREIYQFAILISFIPHHSWRACFFHLLVSVF